MPKLEILEGEERGKKYEWQEGSIRIGRSEANDFVVASSSVSGEHCVIESYENGWRVIDEGSTNGTRLNDRVIKRMAPLHRNDVLKFGDVPVSIYGDDVPEAEVATMPSTSLPRTTIVLHPTDQKAASAHVEGFARKGDGNRLFNIIIIVSVVAIILVAIALIIKTM